MSLDVQLTGVICNPWIHVRSIYEVYRTDGGMICTGLTWCGVWVQVQSMELGYSVHLEIVAPAL
jgi:hypothetical protein